jgi:hypothetical protein
MTAASAALVMALSGCKMTIEVRTVMSRGGSGTFRVVFAIDRELAELARQSAPSGQDPFQQLKNLPNELTRSGWTLKQSTPDGGLRIEIERPFANAEDLNDALAKLEESTGQGGPTPAFFKNFRVRHSGGFLKSSSSIAGTIDLSTAGLLGSGTIPAQNGAALEQIISQGASEFFEFTVRAQLPGRITSSEGDPEPARGGTITWSPKFGQQLDFAATASGYNPVGLGVVGIPILALLGLGVYLIAGRRRPVPAVPGWEAGEPSGASRAEVAETDAPSPVTRAPQAADAPFPAEEPPLQDPLGFTVPSGDGQAADEPDEDAESLGQWPPPQETEPPAQP